ncbi:MAG: YceI family protein [Burkholderiales bacterium]|nr:YceI family protein [Burkholderiales bacterium]
MVSARAATIAGALAAGVALPAAAEDCLPVDAARGSVAFEVKQAGAPFRGRFRAFGGTVCVAEGRATRVEVWLDPASVDSGLPEIDAALRDKDFFDTARHPRVTFASRSVETRGNGQVANGVLQVKATRRDLAVPFTLQREGAASVVAGTLALNRLDYGVGTGEWADTKWLAAEVKVDFRAALARR